MGYICQRRLHARRGCSPISGERLILANRSISRGVACLALCLCGCLPAQEPQPGNLPVIRVSHEVVVEKPERLGVNIGGSYYWSDMQHVANPMGHGGFSQGRQVLLIQAAAGATGNTVRDAAFDATDPDSSYSETFEGGEYCIATGPRGGEKGAITGHDLATGTFTLEQGGEPLAEREVIWLKGPWTSRAMPENKQEGVEQTIGIGDFRPIEDDGAEITLVGSGKGNRDQALRISFSQSAGAGVKHYIRSITGNTYKLHVVARGNGQGLTLEAGMRNHGIPHTDAGNAITMELGGDKALGSEWKEYVFTGSTPDDPRLGEETAVFEIVVEADLERGETAYAEIDAIWLEDEKLKTHHGFNRQMAEAIEEAKCGVLRFYGVTTLGSLVEDFTAASTVDAPWTFGGLKSGGRFNATDAVLDDWLRLSEEVDARPWVNVGSINTPADWEQLISYLCAPPDYDDASRRRAEHGITEPWVNRFDRIYLEIGNEWWNPVFRPFHVMPPEKYGELCALILKAIKAHPHYDADKIKIVAGGWAANGHHWNGIVDKLADADYVSIAPYLLQELNDHGSKEDKLYALFGDVEGYATTGGKSTLDDLRENGSDTKLAVYELNTHLTGGSASAEVASEICTSAAAGVAVLDQAMAVMRDMKAGPINYFTILQRSYNDRLGLWGAMVRNIDGGLRARPVWHGLRLANQHLIAGDMVPAEVSNSPTWDQPENGSVPEMEDVPFLHAYAFREGAALNVLVVNRHPDDALSFTFSLPSGVDAKVNAMTLCATDPLANNEDKELVAIEPGGVENYTAGMKLTVPAASATVYQFQEVQP